jgi:hypothetical protein
MKSCNLWATMITQASPLHHHEVSLSAPFEFGLICCVRLPTFFIGASGGKREWRLAKIFGLTANNCDGNYLPRAPDATNALPDRQAWMPDAADFHLLSG